MLIHINKWVDNAGVRILVREGSFACRVISRTLPLADRSPADTFVIMGDQSVVDIRYPMGHSEVEFNV